MLDFTAIDFETAQPARWSICQVGLVRVENAKIVATYSSLIQPPDNQYVKWNTAIHGISSYLTKESPLFPDIWIEMKGYIENQLVVAHNVTFDAECLQQTLQYYDLGIPDYRVDCTFRKTGVSLVEACAGFEIQLERHHNALQDALACANIYMRLANGQVPDYSKIKQVTGKGKSGFSFPGHEKIKGELLRPSSGVTDTGNVFFGKKVVFTGVLFSIQREEAARIIRDLGADVDTAITSKTDYVIVGSEPGPAKMKKIEKHNLEGRLITIIDEEEFLKIIQKPA